MYQRESNLEANIHFPVLFFIYLFFCEHCFCGFILLKKHHLILKLIEEKEKKTV